MKFKLFSKFVPSGDQPQAIEKLTEGILKGKKYQTLLGVTGSGKTFTMASVIERVQLPVLVISPNKTLAAQLFREFKDFFPQNAVHYFVSYYDYYQPEAYIPQTDTYIAKDAKINDEIDRLRCSATQSLMTRSDIIIVASVSCIYGLGDPAEYEKIALNLKTGQIFNPEKLAKALILLQYQRTSAMPLVGEFRLRGHIAEVHQASEETIFKIEFERNQINKIYQVNKNFHLSSIKNLKIFPAKYFVTPRQALFLALENIQRELKERLKELKKEKKFLEAERLSQRTNYDLEMLRQTGYCPGIENYSRHLTFRQAGEPPFTLIDYYQYRFGDNFLVFIDESHIAIPQIRGMYRGDRSRKKTLIEYGWRLPSAIDNRPLTLSEFEKRINKVIYVSATPTNYEIRKSQFNNNKGVIEQLIRPTGLLDPKVEIRPAKNQIKDLIFEIKKCQKKKERVLVVTLTKRLAEELTDFLAEKDIKVDYLHSEIKTLERPLRLQDLRTGKVEVLVGINLLREGLDLPEVALVAILDADKEGFLRNETTLIQIIGRASRHKNGRAILYADILTDSIKKAVAETQRRRKIQEEYNRLHGITPKTVEKEVRPLLPGFKKRNEEESIEDLLDKYGQSNKLTIIRQLKSEMIRASRNLEFEKAAKLRDFIKKLSNKHN